MIEFINSNINNNAYAYVLSIYNTQYESESSKTVRPVVVSSNEPINPKTHKLKQGGFVQFSAAVCTASFNDSNEEIILECDIRGIPIRFIEVLYEIKKYEYKVKEIIDLSNNYDIITGNKSILINSFSADILSNNINKSKYWCIYQQKRPSYKCIQYTGDNKDIILKEKEFNDESLLNPSAIGNYFIIKNGTIEEKSSDEFVNEYITDDNEKMCGEKSIGDFVNIETMSSLILANQLKNTAIVRKSKLFSDGLKTHDGTFLLYIKFNDKELVEMIDISFWKKLNIKSSKAIPKLRISTHKEKIEFLETVLNNI